VFIKGKVGRANGERKRHGAVGRGPGDALVGGGRRLGGLVTAAGEGDER